LYYYFKHSIFAQPCAIIFAAKRNTVENTNRFEFDFSRPPIKESRWPNFGARHPRRGNRCPTQSRKSYLGRDKLRRQDELLNLCGDSGSGKRVIRARPLCRRRSQIVTTQRARCTTANASGRYCQRDGAAGARNHKIPILSWRKVTG